MLKNRIKKLIASFVIIAQVFCITPAFLGNTSASASSFDYFENTGNENAYIFFDSSLGASHISYREDISGGSNFTQDKLSGKSFNNLYFNISDSFYTKGTDTEFLISVVYYDYWDNSEDFMLTYHNLSGEKVEVRIEKQNREVGWTVATTSIKNPDFSKMYETGIAKNKASLRLSCPGANPIRKIEIANFSKLRRDKKSSSMTALGSTAAENLFELGILTENEANLFFGEDLLAQSSKYELEIINNAFSGKDASISESFKGQLLTQKMLLTSFIRLAGYTPPTIGVVEYAIGKGIIGAEEFFLSDDAPATRYNLITLAKACLYFDPDPDDHVSELPIFKKLLENGIFNGVGISKLRSNGSKEMVDVYLYEDKKLVSSLNEGIEGVTYNFVNYYGEMLYRPYLTLNSWSTGGEAFACATLEEDLGLNPYHLYMYNIKTNTIHYIDDIYSRDACEIVNGEYIYYLKKSETAEGQVQSSIWKKHVSQDDEPELVIEIPIGSPSPTMHITNDGRYVSVAGKTDYFDIPEGTTLLGTLDLETGEYKYTYYSYNYSNVVSHIQINPEYPDLLFFAHEGDGDEFRLEFNYTNIEERANIMNLDTSEATPIHQGHIEEKDQGFFTFSHEQWSHDGEYLYVTNLGGRTTDAPIRGVVRVNKDGTHRKYYDYELPDFLHDQKIYLSSNHSSPSGDNRYFSVDNAEVSILSAQTHQIFPICQLPASGKGHPYHAHAVIASDSYVVSWGDVTQDEQMVLGVAWYDFSHLDDTILAEGGRFSLNEDIEYVRYHETRDKYPELLADITEETKDGKNALYAPEGKNIYLDINENIVDSSDETVKITFEYYDDSTEPITLSYTKGYRERNDLCETLNMFKTVQRNGSNTWKTASLVIESGNFEGIGKYESDFSITGAGGVYIGDVRAETLSSYKNQAAIAFSQIEENADGYMIFGKVSKKKADIQGINVIGASFGTNKQLGNASIEAVDLSVDFVGNFTMLLPKSPNNGEVKFYVWDKTAFPKPMREETVLVDLDLRAVSKANGVSLSWNSVEGTDTYEIYKDGKKIAETSETSYNDKYFSTVEEFHNDFKKEFTTDHSYLIVAGKYVSKSVKACADTSLIKYISFYNNTNGSYGIETGRSNPYVKDVAALNKESHGIRMSSHLPDSNMGDLNPYENIVLPETYSRFFYNEGKTSTYKTRFVGGGEDENTFFADRNGLRLVTATCADRATIVSYLKKNTNAGKAASTAISDSTTGSGYTCVTTKPFGVVESFGSSGAEEYVVLLTARVPNSDSINLFEVTTKVPTNTRNTATDSSWAEVAEAVPYANGTDEIIRVYHGTTGRETGRSFTPAEDNKFSDPGYKTDVTVFKNMFYTYEFNIKAYFGDKLVNTGVDNYWKNDVGCDSNIRFVADEESANGDTATVRSIAFIKANDYIK